MPNINLSDVRKRDAVVKAESVLVRSDVRYQDAKGRPCYTRKVLKATIEHDYISLRARYDSDEALGKALVDADPEIDFERDGMFLWDASRAYITPDDTLVFRIRQEEVIYNPDNALRERRPRRELNPNVDADIPLRWSGKFIDKQEAIRKFIFRSKLQILHINGLTFDFLYEMAKTLHEKQALMMLGAGPRGTEPLVFRRGAIPYRAFLEGRIEGETYLLLLHLSNMELKTPQGPAAPGDDA